MSLVSEPPKMVITICIGAPWVAPKPRFILSVMVTITSPFLFLVEVVDKLRLAPCQPILEQIVWAPHLWSGPRLFLKAITYEVRCPWSRWNLQYLLLSRGAMFFFIGGGSLKRSHATARILPWVVLRGVDLEYHIKFFARCGFWSIRERMSISWPHRPLFFEMRSFLSRYSETGRSLSLWLSK